MFPLDPNILLSIAGDDPQTFQVLSLINTELSRVFNISEYWKRFPFKPVHQFKTPQNMFCRCGNTHRLVFGPAIVRLNFPRVYMPEPSSISFVRLDSLYPRIRVHLIDPANLSRSVIPIVDQISAQINRVENMTSFNVEFGKINNFKPVIVHAPLSKREIVQTFTRNPLRLRESGTRTRTSTQHDKRPRKRKWMTRH
jgi:hypothetical protein